MVGLRHLSVGRKFAVVSGLGLLAVLAGGLVSFTGVQRIGTDQAVTARVTGLNEQLALLSAKEGDVQITERDMLLAISDAARSKAYAELTAIKAAAGAAWSTISQCPCRRLIGPGWIS